MKNNKESLYLQELAYHEQAMRLEQGTITVMQEGSPAHINMHNITPVATDYPSMLQDNSVWPLLSCLSSPPVLLFTTEGMKHFLRLFDYYAELNRPLSRHIRRHIDGIMQVEERLTDRMPANALSDDINRIMQAFEHISDKRSCRLLRS